MNLAETKQLLQEYYQLASENIPQKRVQSEWKPENNFGFLLGVLAFGIDFTSLNSIVCCKTNILKKTKRHLLAIYNNESESCCTSGYSSAGPRPNSVEDSEYELEEREFSHRDLKKALLNRDGVCLFCWNPKSLKGSHIIAEKNIPMAYDEDSLFIRAGITHKHQVQNGLLLCGNCHDEFDLLKQYVDVDDDGKLVIKVVNDTNDSTSDKHREWIAAVEDLEVIRRTREPRWSHMDNRRAVEFSGEMALYFVQNTPSELPSRDALAFHKAACLIWRMAGGAETDDEYCSDDEPGPVDTSALRKLSTVNRFYFNSKSGY